MNYQIKRSNNSVIDCTIYGNVDKSDTFILGIHGGCFWDGDHTWDKNISIKLTESNKCVVMQLNFDQTDYGTVMQDLYLALQTIKDNFVFDKIGLLGGSSGGFFALELLSYIKFKLDFCILLCPVAAPYKRYEYLVENKNDQIIKKQMNHFLTVENMQHREKYVSNMKLQCPTLVILGDNDKNVPPNVTKELISKDNIKSHILSGGHELCYKAPQLVVDLIFDFII